MLNEQHQNCLCVCVPTRQESFVYSRVARFKASFARIVLQPGSSNRIKTLTWSYALFSPPFSLLTNVVYLLILLLLLYLWQTFPALWTRGWTPSTIWSSSSLSSSFWPVSGRRNASPITAAGKAKCASSRIQFALSTSLSLSSHWPFSFAMQKANFW